MPHLSLEKVTKRFFGRNGAEIVAVSALELEVIDRELLVLTGPSGCGKTTILRLIAGLAHPDSGFILQDRKPIVAGPCPTRQVAMIFQQHALYPHMTAFDNVAFGLQVRRVPRDLIQKKVREVGSLTGTESLLNRLPQELSGGECQRVALARALALEPSLLLLDEPLSSVDAPGRVQLREDIVRLQRQLRITMVYVTHDQVEAMAVGDRIAVMKGGILQQAGTPVEIYDYPANAFIASFFGSPPMNLLAGTVDSGSPGTFTLNRAGPGEALRIILPCGMPAGPALLGIRPEHLEPVAAPSNPKLSIPVRVESVHFAGCELHVRCQAGDQVIIARAPRTFSAVAGQQLTLSAEWANVKPFAVGE